MGNEVINIILFNKGIDISFFWCWIEVVVVLKKILVVKFLVKSWIVIKNILYNELIVVNINIFYNFGIYIVYLNLLF